VIVEVRRLQLPRAKDRPVTVDAAAGGHRDRLRPSAPVVPRIPALRVRAVSRALFVLSRAAQSSTRESARGFPLAPVLPRTAWSSAPGELRLRLIADFGIASYRRSERVLSHAGSQKPPPPPPPPPPMFRARSSASPPAANALGGLLSPSRAWLLGEAFQGALVRRIFRRDDLFGQLVIAPLGSAGTYAE